MKSFLGALSVGSGVAMVAAPRQLSRLYGLPAVAALGRGLGLRDVAVGLCLLRRDPRSGLAARAASDLLDFGLIWRERRRRPDSRWTAARLTTALLSAGLAGGMRAAARAARPRRWLRGAETFVRQQPGLALGGAFLLGVTTARMTRARPGTRSSATHEARATGASRQESSPVSRTPLADPAEHSMPREAPETTGVGSPIGDAPYAGGSRY